MRAAEQWSQLEATLDPTWAEAEVTFVPEGDPAEAAAVLAPLQPGRAGRELHLHVTRAGGGLERARNIFRQLDRKRVWGILSLVDAAVDTPSATITPAPVPARTLVEAWGDAVATLPPDWSDVLCELELDSSDHLPRAALLGAPLNPTRVPEEIALRFRVSGKQGYGASPQMARRSFERMDAEGITGRIRIVYDLSDAENAVTQGPVWRVAGRSV